MDGKAAEVAALLRARPRGWLASQLASLQAVRAGLEEAGRMLQAREVRPALLLQVPADEIADLWEQTTDQLEGRTEGERPSCDGGRESEALRQVALRLASRLEATLRQRGRVRDYELRGPGPDPYPESSRLTRRHDRAVLDFRRFRPANAGERHAAYLSSMRTS